MYEYTSFIIIYNLYTDYNIFFIIKTEVRTIFYYHINNVLVTFLTIFPLLKMECAVHIELAPDIKELK